MNTFKHAKDPLIEARMMLEKDGAEGWNVAKEILLRQETDDPQLKQALAYVTSFPDFFRPAVVAYCCKAVGGDPKVTVPTAASLTLLAKAIGIHDSIIDRTKKRNGQTTTFGKFGKEIALILSDILLFKGFTLLRRNLEIGVPPSTVIKILETIDRVWFEQSEGAVLDFKLRGSLNISPKEYLKLVTKKASELDAIARIGGILGQGSQEEIETLGKIGRILGTISLLRDEIVDMLEFNVLKYRIKHEPPPLPVIYAAQKADVKSKILSIISKEKLTIKDMKRLSRIVDKAEGINKTAHQIVKRAKEAEQCLPLFRREKVGVMKLKILIESHIVHQVDWKRVLY